MMHSSLIRNVVVLCLVTYAYAQQCDPIADNARFDCYPEDGPTKEKCEARKCCWRPPTQQTNLKNYKDDLTPPYCYYPSDFPTYELMQNETTGFGQRFYLYRSQTTYLPYDILNLTVDLVYETQQRFRIKIYDSYYSRYQVPLPVPYVDTKAETTDYDVTVNSKPFWIRVTRKSTNATLFDSSISPLIFGDQFIKISTKLSSPLIYGLGEHEQPLLMNVTHRWKKLSFWARDVAPTMDTNLYGDHPFYINLELNNGAPTDFHGQFMLNSNAMDIDVQPTPALTYTTIGGIIDLYVFSGPTIEDVIEQYWDVIGKPMIPPYWSLGFHLCRYGYNNIDNLTTVIARMEKANFPYDVQWTDIDAMRSYLDFTYDDQAFKDLPTLVNLIQSESRYYVNIIDPGISSTQEAGSYLPYDEGISRGIFIKKANSDDPIIGKVWPGETAFPDFTHPNASQWWTEMAGAFHLTVPFDGMWIDMNEPSNFVDGSIEGCINNTLDNPPFVPHILGGSLSSKTLCPSARQYLSQHYNLHSMYGYFEAQASNMAMAAVRSARPFVLTRSTFPGSGQYAAHWTGDNYASFEEMHDSISTILSFNMFGITQVGADICGFRGDTTDELCTRWMQLGAFYPFMRNHNAIGARDQDPAAFPADKQKIMKDALTTRYALMPYWYTLFHHAATRSRTVVRPLLFEYPNDVNTYKIDQQFLVGPALLISPNLTPDSSTVHAYVPQDVWYDFVTGAQVTTTGQFVDLDAPLDKINVHVRGGFIIPKQVPGDNLMKGRNNPFELLVSLSASGNATGHLYWDNGDSLDPLGNGEYNLFEFNITSANTLTIECMVANYTEASMTLQRVDVLGVNQNVTGVNVNGKSYSSFQYNIGFNSLSIFDLKLNMTSADNQTIDWVTSDYLW